MLNDSIAYRDRQLYVDDVAVADIAAQVGTPVYIYSLRRILDNLERIWWAFGIVAQNIHYSAKANANLTILRTIIESGTSIDAVSGGEIFRALKAGANAEDIVFAGVGKTPAELRYALEVGVEWFNVENVRELDHLNAIAGELDRTAQIALRLNPEVSANTHRYIATGHGGAKFGLTAETIRTILARQSEYPHLNFEGIHVHIGSQLHDTAGTRQAIEIALELMAPYPQLKTLNIGGGLPVPYEAEADLPTWEAFAAEVKPLLKGYDVYLEPGRSVVADAGILVGQVLYTKQQAGETFYITDASMTELIRPALYEAHHEIIPVRRRDSATSAASIVGPVCETADVLGQNRDLPALNEGDLLAVLTSGAYGMVMSSNYNARPRPAEVAVNRDGKSWQVIRQRETWDNLIELETM
ncbi:MAG: diaminopimelate decarboxylase [bacterium]|nr:diaminopimelate decarboxylase [bacterium]